jgi:hypothetical protein
MGSWGEQYSTGDQSMCSRELFWGNNYGICPICEKSNIIEEKDCAGCRHNGDGYGTCVFKCKDCNWTTSFQYDESDTPYFYETRYFGETCYDHIVVKENEITKPPEQSEGLLNGYKQLLKIGASSEYIAEKLRLSGYEPDFVQCFVAQHQFKTT